METKPISEESFYQFLYAISTEDKALIAAEAMNWAYNMGSGDNCWDYNPDTHTWSLYDFSVMEDEAPEAELSAEVLVESFEQDYESDLFCGINLECGRDVYPVFWHKYDAYVKQSKAE